MHLIAEDILTFWFGTTDLSTVMERRQVCFRSTPEFEATLRERYTVSHERATVGAFDGFVETCEECLALVLALDQFPRIALNRGYDEGICPAFRVFLYLPFEHSENVADQDRALELYKGLGEERSLAAAIGHRDAILRFGRFPHRNAVLGRDSTPEEKEYLKEPPSWGLTAEEFAEWEREKAEREAAAADS